MKKISLYSLLTLLVVVLHWGCTYDFGASVSDINEPLANRGKGNGNGNGGNDGDAPAIYAVQYSGNIISSDVAYLKLTGNSGKVTELHSICDASFASVTSTSIGTKLEGLNILFNYLSPTVNCYNLYECSWSISLSQFNKKKYPDRIKVSFWFEDPSAPDGNLRFSMFGTLLGEFLPTTSTPTEVLLDKWMVEVDSSYDPLYPECLHINTFFSDDNIPNQSLTIRLVDQETEGNDLSLCESKPGC